MKSLKTLSTVVLALVLTLGSGLSAADPPDHAQGNPPQKFYWIDVFGEPSTFVFPFIVECDGFGTVMTLTLDGFWIFHPKNNGRDAWEFYHSAWPSRIANANDETLYVEGIPGQVINRHWTGEPFASDPIETGVQLMITLPGHGVIYRDVGRVRFDWDTSPLQPTFLAGHWDSYDADYQALCEALTPNG